MTSAAIPQWRHPPRVRRATQGELLPVLRRERYVGSVMDSFGFGEVVFS